MNLDRKRDYWESYEDAIKLISSVYGRFSNNIDGKYNILACDDKWIVAQLENISEFCAKLKGEIDKR